MSKAANETMSVGSPARSTCCAKITPSSRRAAQCQRAADSSAASATDRGRACIIAEVGYEEYFLVVWDILPECQRRGIAWITRGSAADSLVCYALGISGVCPIRFELYFRRFLNRERMALNKLPDIDIDFAHDRRDDVVDLIFERYGPRHAAIVGGLSTDQSRSAIAAIAKVLGVSEFQIRRLTEHVPRSSAGHVAAAVAGTQECRDSPWQEEPYRTALQMASFLDGFPRHPKMHPCGVVLSRDPITALTPTFMSAKGYATTHFEVEAVETVGLAKKSEFARRAQGLEPVQYAHPSLEPALRSARFGRAS